MGDEAVMDGVSMQEGTMSQSGIVSFFDFAQTPDMVQEVHLMTSSYEPEYGTTTGGVMVVTTKSGTDQIHASAFEYLRNRDFNALQFTNNRGPGDQRPKDNENEYGFSGGLPVKLKFLPFVWGPKHKTYFFNDTEFLRSLGGASRALLTIPSMQDRTGNFSDWSTPIYDPRTETECQRRDHANTVPWEYYSRHRPERSGVAMDEILADSYGVGPDQQFPGPTRFRRHSVEPQRIPVPDRPLLGRERSLLLHYLAAGYPTDRAVPVARTALHARTLRIRRTPGLTDSTGTISSALRC